MNLHTRPLLLLAVAVAQTYGGIYDKVSQLPTHSYDIIIVGGGTAGNVLANRLTENSNIQVLVIEAGGSNEGIVEGTIPLLSRIMSEDQYDWKYTTTPQPGLNGRSIPYRRGKILGGSSSTNGMVYHTGSRDDWDYISRVTGDPAWAWDATARHRNLNQRYVAPNDGHDDTNQYLPLAHSRNGTLSVSLPGYTYAGDSRVIAAAAELDFVSEFPFQRDVNTGNTIGVGWVQATIGNGQRSSSATSYVGPKYIDRPNLHILLHAHATKLLEATGLGTTTPTFNVVEFGTGPSSQRWQVTAHKEVILSAGAINTPQLLMLSGIGDPVELASLGIPTRVNLPSVGKNMTDHVGLANGWRISSNETFDPYLDPDLLPRRIQEWNRTHQGPLSWINANLMAFLRLPPNDPIIQTHSDPTAGPTSAHYQLTWMNGWRMKVPKPEGNWIMVLSNLISPTSRGNIKLRNSNPFEPPMVNPNFLSTEFDIKTTVAAIKAAKRFMAAQAWRGFAIAPWEPLESSKTDEEIAQYARNYASTMLHIVGTAAMSQRGAPWGVLDSDLRVKGTNGLRVVDASAIPYVPSGHTQGPVYLLAEVAAEKIKADQRHSHPADVHPSSTVQSQELQHLISVPQKLD